MSSSFQCRYGCGTWCYCDPRVKTASGKLIPINSVTHEKHDCHLSPWFRSNNTKAKAVAKQELQKIESWANQQRGETLT